MLPLIVAVILAAGETRIDATQVNSTHLNAQVSSPDGEFTEPLRNESRDAALQYYELLSKPAAERGRAFSELPSATKSSVWTYHLSIALVRHPEFTREQRDLIIRALQLLTPRLFSIEAMDPDWSVIVDEPLQNLTKQAKRLFIPAVVRELFATLGPDEAAVSGPGIHSMDCPPIENPSNVSPSLPGGAKSILKNGSMQPKDLPYCQCSGISDYCDSSGVGIYYCAGGGCYWTNSGCGTFWRYACTGLCASKPT